jgi:nucleoside-diphosphate-sugar epimerase
VRILITGNMGYVGSVLVRHLRCMMPQAQLIGYDLGLFGHCLTDTGGLPERFLDRQIFGDVRDIDPACLDGIDAVVNLAAVSNDPMGNRFAAVTDEINHRAVIRLADIARDKGVRSFVFASSCSVYGFAEGGPRRESDAVDPLTPYARSKVDTENSLRGKNSGGMTVTSLRFATACGASPRLRLDLVLNDFVAGAITGKEVTVLSDGSPWRPLIDVSDMARAIEWAVARPRERGGDCLAVNIGADACNIQVGELAHTVAAELPGTRVSINTAAAPDKRSYRVDFELFRSLAPAHQPQMTVNRSIATLATALRKIDFTDRKFRSGPNIRLTILDRLIASGELGNDLRWNPTPLGASMSR